MLLLPAAGCASIMDGSHQTISVATYSVGGNSYDHTVANALCTLKNKDGTWFVRAPGTVTVHRDYDDLNVECSRPGFRPGVRIVASTTKNLEFGNILFGGIIGTGVDVNDGAAFDYPYLINVPMQPQTKTAASPASQPLD
ncbi:hypothetical protein [Acidiphilium sp.]|uniref:hypothetical protein n=1 Tax=Acidiphilium sp. TaxID=527 RepID=UPI003D046EA5